MYHIKTIEDRIRVPPEMFGSELEDAVQRILRERYEGRIYKDLGIVLSIDQPKVLTEGAIIPGDSGAYYTVSFEALTFIPVVNEVYRAEVKEIVEFGAFASIGPFQGLLHVSQIGKEKYYYDKKAKTLSSREAGRAVKKGDEVLVKVSTVSLKSTSSDTKIGLTMRPDGLGKPEWFKPKKAAPAKAEKKKKKGDAK
ncbi:MAG: DNA-directed RNA polymerase [Candidatus ainarchaeum sp.]|nr:DNA-directed RNA polymerase [Candidatus ainarchaeum sp.]